MYLAQYIERMGTGTGDMISRCRDAGLPEPEFTLSDGFVTTIRRKSRDVGTKPESRLESVEFKGEVEPQSESLEIRVLRLLVGAPLSRSAIAQHLGHTGISGRLNKLIIVMLTDKSIEYTLPEEPNSRMQQYRLTEKGEKLLSSRQ